MKGLTVSVERRSTNFLRAEDEILITGDFHFSAVVRAYVPHYSAANNVGRELESQLTKEMEYRILSELMNVIAQEAESKVYVTPRIQKDKVVTIAHPERYYQAMVQQTNWQDIQALETLKQDVENKLKVLMRAQAGGPIE